MLGSLGEEELDQMIRDYIESDQSTSPTPVSKPAPKKSQSILQDILLEATDIETQLLDKVLMYVRGMGEPNSLKKWVAMRLQMDGYEASLCKTSWVSSLGLKVIQFTGDYDYIDVMIMDQNSSNKTTRLIVDMDLRSQFELARPTQTYKELINALPSVFVGSEERLDKIISLLCSAAKASLKENDLHIPPWRKAEYMQSKWFSKNCNKVSVMLNPELGSDASEEKNSATCCPSIF
ncbi:hypothetical protein Peur_010277 [Populus x canadensis]|uniref:uncharacterized protein LOC133690665 n=1 Tax=Populus nigra TaxID=3691 RepID=UPI002B2770FD|nr:uncharacterized protein LOC133690665 [Populus nigra]